MPPKKGKGKGRGRDLARDTPAPPIQQATPPATPSAGKKEEEEWWALAKDWASKLAFAVKTLRNLMPEIRDPQLRQAVDLVDGMEGKVLYRKYVKGDTIFENEETLLGILQEGIATAMRSSEDFDFNSESSSDDDTVTELKKEVKRMEKEIKRLKTGWSDSGEDVTGLKSLLSERKKEVEDLKAEVKKADDMATQVREGFQERLRNAERVALSQRQKLKEAEEALKKSSEKEEGWLAQVTNLQDELKKEKERSKIDEMREANFQEAAKWREKFTYLDNRFGEENVKAYTDMEEKAKKIVEENNLRWEEKLKREVGLARGRGQTKDKQAQTEPQKSEKTYAEAAQQTPPVLPATPVPVSTASADVKGKGRGGDVTMHNISGYEDMSEYEKEEPVTPRGGNTQRHTNIYTNKPDKGKAWVVHRVSCQRPMAEILQDAGRFFGERLDTEVHGGRWLLNQSRRVGKITSSVVIFLRQNVCLEGGVKLGRRWHSTEAYDFDRKPVAGTF